MARIAIAFGFTAAALFTGGFGLAPLVFGANSFSTTALVTTGLLGFQVGNMLGAALFPAHGPHQYGPRLNDLQASTSVPGSPIPIPYGETRYAAQIIWAPGLVESSQTVTQQSKDGGVTSTTYRYSASFAASFGEGPLDIEEIWGDSKVLFIWDEAPSSNTIPAYNSANSYAEGDIVSFNGKYYIALANVPASGAFAPTAIPFGILLWTQYTGPLSTSSVHRYTVPTVYPGDDTQNPDPTILASNGDTLASNANTPAYRGTGYAVWNNLFLQDFGNRIPNIVGLIKSRNSKRLDNVVADICTRCNVESGDLDLSGLSTVNLRGYTITRPTDGRTAISQLAQAYFFDLFESDFKLRGKLRDDAGDPVLTVPEVDLGLEKDNAKLSELIQQSQELPIEVEVQYSDPAMVWQTNKQQRRRHAHAVRTRNKAVIELPLVLTQSEAIQIAERYLYLSWLERKPWNFNLWKASYTVLDPTDVFAFVYQGKTYRARMVKNSIGQNFVTEVAAVSHDSTAYQSAAIGGGSDGTFVTNPPITAETILWQFDLPYLQDSDAQSNLTGDYWAVGSTTSPYGGAAFLSSLDDVNFSTIGGSTIGAAFGVTLDGLGDPPADWTWDDVNTLTVQVEAGTISSTTDAAVYEGANSALLQKGDGSTEVIQFGTATLIGLASDGSDDSIYELSHLLRGRRNTEFASTGHIPGETIVFLPTGLQRRASLPLSFIGATRYYKGVTFGVDPSTVDAQTFVSAGNDLKPASPVHVTGSLDGSNNLTIGWTRRTRYGGLGLVGPTPLHEDSEAYSIDIYSGSSVVRTIAWGGLYNGSGLPYVAYSAADQTSDGLTPGNAVHVKIYQLSAQVGRGQAADATVPADLAVPTGLGTPTYSTDFSTLTGWTATNNAGPVEGGGSFDSSFAAVSGGMLRLKLTQDGTTAGSVGSELVCNTSFGYGTYEWHMRASSDSSTPSGAGSNYSGQVSACFTYFDGGDPPYTEIDCVEIEGQTPNILEQTNWTSSTVQDHSSSMAGFNPWDGFHYYKMVWSPTSIKYYVDDVLVATHVTDIPTHVAPPVINHWGTNSADFGGFATSGVTRYMFVDSFKFWAA